MATEYEQLLQKLLVEKKAELDELKLKDKPNPKKINSVQSEINFVQVELRRYEQGLAVFRSKGLPKVGRWGKPETGEEQEETAAK